MCTVASAPHVGRTGASGTVKLQEDCSLLRTRCHVSRRVPTWTTSRDCMYPGQDRDNGTSRPYRDWIRQGAAMTAAMSLSWRDQCIVVNALLLRAPIPRPPAACPTHVSLWYARRAAPE